MLYLHTLDYTSPKLVGWLGAASLWLQSHAVPSPSTSALGHWLIPFAPHQPPMRGEVSRKGTRVPPASHPADLELDPQQGLVLSGLC